MNNSIMVLMNIPGERYCPIVTQGIYAMKQAYLTSIGIMDPFVPKFVLRAMLRNLVCKQVSSGYVSGFTSNIDLGLRPI